MDQSTRTMVARMGAHALHAKYDSRDLTAAARSEFMSRFEREVDPDGALPADERARRAVHARKAYFMGLALKSAQARSRRTQGAIE